MRDAAGAKRLIYASLPCEPPSIPVKTKRCGHESCATSQSANAPQPMQRGPATHGATLGDATCTRAHTHTCFTFRHNQGRQSRPAGRALGKRCIPAKPGKDRQKQTEGQEKGPLARHPEQGQKRTGGRTQARGAATRRPRRAHPAAQPQDMRGATQPKHRHKIHMYSNRSIDLAMYTQINEYMHARTQAGMHACTHMPL